MKKILTIVVLSFTFLVGCNKRISMLPELNGSMSVSLDEYSIQYVTKSETVLDQNDFDYEILGSAGNVFMEGKLRDIPDIIEDVPIDDYVINVSSPAQMPAAYDQPIIAGSQSFSISKASMTSVVVNCTVRNIKVSVKPDDFFFNELAYFTVTVSNGDGADNRLTWTNGELLDANYSLLTKENVDEARSGYFTVASALDIKIIGYRKVSGLEAVYEGSIKAPAAKDHYILKLSADMSGQIGGTTKPGINITVDYTTNDKDEEVNVPGFEFPPVDGSGDGSDGDEEDGEEGGEPQGLSLGWEANPSFGKYELKEVYEENEVTLTVNAENHIQGFIVKIASPAADFISTVKRIAGSYEEGEYVVLDLLKEETAKVMTFLPSGEALLNKDRIEFPLGDLFPLILAFSPDLGSVHTFIMEVTDTEGQVLRKELLFEYRGN